MFDSCFEFSSNNSTERFLFVAGMYRMYNKSVGTICGAQLCGSQRSFLLMGVTQIVIRVLRHTCHNYNNRNRTTLLYLLRYISHHHGLQERIGWISRSRSSAPRGGTVCRISTSRLRWPGPALRIVDPIQGSKIRTLFVFGLRHCLGNGLWGELCGKFRGVDLSGIGSDGGASGHVSGGVHTISGISKGAHCQHRGRIHCCHRRNSFVDEKLKF